jgi:CheY-like chemotaxis protein
MDRSSPVLVAEDDESDVFLLRLAFQRAGLSTQLIIARDGQEVVDYLSPGSPDRLLPGLLLLDLKMPRMGGFEVLAWLGAQAALKDLPVLVFSSSSQEADVQKACALGAREYLVKPQEFGDLIRLVQDVHHKYLAAA